MQRRAPSLPGLDAWVRARPGLVDALFAAALALVAFPSAVALVGAAPWPPAARAALLGVLLAGHVAVAFRRSRPVAAFAACCAVMLVLVLTPDVTGPVAGDLAGVSVPPVLLPSSAVFLVVLYAVAAHAAPPWPSLSLAGALAGAAAVTARLWSDPSWISGQPVPAGPGWRLFVVLGLVTAVLAPWGLGRFRAVRAAYVQALEERARRAEEEQERRAEQAVLAERARIAREMHDVVAHSLAVMVRQAEGGRLVAAKDPARAVQALTAVAGAGREALADMRTALGALRPDEPAAAAPQPAVQDVPALVERVRGAGLDVELVVVGEPVELERAVSLAAYRVVQEALTNVVKHAGAGARARVELRWRRDGLRVAVRDDGSGGAGSGRERVDGQGLVGMRERVVLAGGELSAGPGGDRGGFAVAAELPARGARR
ncbi:signal transduction histidine kinase [Kineococcus xinjiangensis]|uniref:histidine kinase n=1 Tax=Kineococcus xinjiangensis TaxID=512762 RepID=A0A2S6IJ40_9ACTN|nr:histidine kinase [Kineococcus xinjiangensis]PPK94237.1 signal transduction histidine kinase [Kineococcus xinjiangensis]